MSSIDYHHEMTTHQIYDLKSWEVRDALYYTVQCSKGVLSFVHIIVGFRNQGSDPRSGISRAWNITQSMVRSQVVRMH